MTANVKAIVSMEKILLARIVIVSLAPIQWGAISAYALGLAKFRDSFQKRFVVWLVTMSVTFGVVVAQIYVYTAITAIQHPVREDIFFASALVVESIVSVVLLVLMVRREKRRTAHG
jgi:RsiW-degrading membrane proteinase PrsW (M82 family)